MKHYAMVQFRGEKLRIEAEDAADPVAVTVGKWDDLNGKRGDESECALTNSINREKNSFPHEVFGACTVKNTTYVFDRMKEGKPSRCIRYLHNFDVHDFDIHKKGDGSYEVPVLLRPKTGRDRYGHREKAKPYQKTPAQKSASSGGGRRKQRRGVNARLIMQREWIDSFISKHGLDRHAPPKQSKRRRHVVAPPQPAA